LDIVGGVGGSIDENDALGAGDRLGEFGGKEGAGQGLDTWKVQGRYGLGGFRTDAVVAAEGVAVTEDQEFGSTI
jgi:hypothetical protein